MATYKNPQISSFAQMDDGSKCNKQPVNLFYSCFASSNTESVQVHTDGSAVFLTTTSEVSSEGRSVEQSGESLEIESDEDEGYCCPFKGQSSKRVKISCNGGENINLLSGKATIGKCSQTDAIGSHSTAPLQRCSKNRDRSLRGSFDEESECSTACETHSDGVTTHEASEFSPFITFQSPKGPKMEEMRLDDDDFCLDSSSLVDEHDSELREGIEIAYSYEGTCTRKPTKNSKKSVLKFTCKLNHTFDLTLESAKSKWCSRCCQSLKNMQEYAASLKGRVLNRYFDEKIIFECEHNHVWTCSNKNAKKKWCSDCLRENKKNIKKQLKEEHKKIDMEAEEFQKQLFENARKQSSKIPSANTSTTTQGSIGSQAALIQYLQRAEADIEKSAKKKTTEYMVSQEYKGDCTQDQILQVYKIIVMPEDILQTYMLSLSLECLRAEYKRLAKVIHPDKNKHPDAGNAFQRIHSMYESALGKLSASC